MKKLYTIFNLVLLLTILLGADVRSTAPVPTTPPAKPCQGYTIIEFGKAVDCQGDTIALIKKRGVPPMIAP